MVDRPTPIIAAIWSTVTVLDSCRRRTSLTCFSSSLVGRPPFLPLARADQVAFELGQTAEDSVFCPGNVRFSDRTKDEATCNGLDAHF